MSKETLIENLRGYKSTPRHCEELCYEAANEIESLRQQLAAAQSENERLAESCRDAAAQAETDAGIIKSDGKEIHFLRQHLHKIALDWQVAQQQLATLQAENVTCASNLRGKHAITGATYNTMRQQLAECQAAIEGLNGRFEKDQDRIACQVEQLAAALAAIKVKDSLLENLIAQYSAPIKAEYEKILAIQPDDSALKMGLDKAWQRDPDQ